MTAPRAHRERRARRPPCRSPYRLTRSTTSTAGRHAAESTNRRSPRTALRAARRRPDRSALAGDRLGGVVLDAANKHTGVVKSGHDCAVVDAAMPPCEDDGTRDRVARSLLENGPLTAAALAERLGAHPGRRPPPPRRAGRRRGRRGPRAARLAAGARPGPAGPGRSALTEAGRDAFDQAYDDLAAERAALPRRGRRPRGGRARSPASGSPSSRPATARLVDAADPDGPRPRRSPARCPPTATPPRSTRRQRPAAGEQLCQHHCPVAHVAAEFPAAVRGRDRGRSPGCSARTSSAWPPSPTATASAPPTSRTPPSTAHQPERSTP